MKKYIAPIIKVRKITAGDLLQDSDPSFKTNNKVVSTENQLSKPNSIWDDMEEDNSRPPEE